MSLNVACKSAARASRAGKPRSKLLPSIYIQMKVSCAIRYSGSTKFYKSRTTLVQQENTHQQRHPGKKTPFPTTLTHSSILTLCRTSCSVGQSHSLPDLLHLIFLLWITIFSSIKRSSLVKTVTKDKKVLCMCHKKAPGTKILLTYRYSGPRIKNRESANI